MQAYEIDLAARDLEELRQLEQQEEELYDRSNPRTPAKHSHRRFPTSCLNILRSIEGNSRCVDCNATNPQWATISYGALLCIDCSGCHRQLGVQVSTVRSISMDSWSHSEVLSILEGGNKQLNDFFDRHGLPSSFYQLEDDDTHRNRYKTNAAAFYRDNLSLHVKGVEKEGSYKGRHAFKKKSRRRKFKRSCAVENENLDSSETIVGA